MPYKILITGNNNKVISDISANVSGMEVMSVANRYEDIEKIMKYFVPDAFVYCAYEEVSEDYSRNIKVNQLLSKNKIPFVVCGSEEDCDKFQNMAANVSKLMVYMPLDVNQIQERISTFIQEWKKASESGTETKSLEPYRPKRRRRIYGRGRILAIDDNPLMLKVIKEHLNEKYDVATAISGKVALRFLENRKVDVILLDYEMPELDGPAVLEKLREMETAKDVPVIFLTGASERKKITKALMMKPDGYLLKPIDHDKLMAEIEKYIY